MEQDLNTILIKQEYWLMSNYITTHWLGTCRFDLTYLFV